LVQRSEDEDSLEGSAEDGVETMRKRRRFDEAALERKRELRLWNEQRLVFALSLGDSFFLTQTFAEPKLRSKYLLKSKSEVISKVWSK